MKRFTRIGSFLFICAALLGTAEGASISSIINSKHDLSSAGTASIRSTGLGTDQTCVFCHTPHSGRKDAPLWNKTDVTGPYTAYASDVLTALGMAGEDPSSKVATGYNAHVKTRICLSCHDGTIALGNLVNWPSGVSSNIPMQGTGVDAQGKLMSSSAGFMGLDLSDDHPVAIRHDTTKDAELTAPDTGKRIWLYDIAAAKTGVGTGAGYVECTTCHNAHDNQWGNFLVSGNDGSKVCLGCHTKALGAVAGSAHDNATTVGYAPPSGAKAPNPTTLGSSVGAVKCMACHFPHKAGITDTSQLPAAAPGSSGKYLLSFQEDMSCFGNPNRWKSPNPVNVCHGTGGVGAAGRNIDIQTQVNKAYPGNSAHGAIRSGNINAAYSNKHGATEQGLSGSGKYGTIQTHVVCSDCHNSHTTGTINHAQGTNTIATTSPLYGAGGVSYAGGLGAWTAPNAAIYYNAYEPLGATTSNSWPLPKYEYEICFKCHTSFAWGAGARPNISDLTNIPNMTDQLQEFNPANPSYHTVMAGLSASSYAPPNASFANGWTSGSLMYCSDCHGNDTATGQPQGPHGSANPGILIKAFSDTYGTAGGAAQAGTDLCYQCHAYAVYGNPGLNTANGTNTGFSSTGNVNLHTQHAYRERTGFAIGVANPLSYKCVNCHTRVSHGWKRRGLVVFLGDGAGYEAGGLNTGPIANTSALPAVPGANQYGVAINANCTTANGCHQ